MMVGVLPASDCRNSLVPAGRIISSIEDQGFEVRHEESLREHYALTLAAWWENLDEHWDEAVAENWVTERELPTC